MDPHYYDSVISVFIDLYRKGYVYRGKRMINWDPKAKTALSGMDDSTLLGTWRMMKGDREIFAVPRIGMVRSIMLNHWYHHRGQLSVYLRELDVPIPSIYGPSADENPFG